MEMQSTLTNKVAAEVEAMCHYATANGLKVPAKLVSDTLRLIDQAPGDAVDEDADRLSELHHRFCDIVAPAKPQTLLLLLEQKRESPLLAVIGAVPIVRHIMLTSVLFLFMFVIVGQLEIINSQNLLQGILNTDGWVTIAVLGYLMSCAGLGACFSTLYRLNNYLSKATYDSRFDSTYWTSILLGVIAGIFISELLAPTLATPGSDTIDNLGKPALALVGGFSANMVYKVLQRVVDTIESLFKGDQRAIVDRELRSREAAHSNTNRGQKMNFAASLVDLEKSIEGKSQDEISAEIRGLVQQALKRD